MSKRPTMDNSVAEQQRRYLATARHHERMAELLRQAGKLADAKAAEKAAATCRERTG